MVRAALPELDAVRGQQPAAPVPGYRDLLGVGEPAGDRFQRVVQKTRGGWTSPPTRGEAQALSCERCAGGSLSMRRSSARPTCVTMPRRCGLAGAADTTGR